MKKLNKKGVTLIELIVSFAIVSVALLYFYQTIVDLHRMYKNSTKATDEFVDKDYALRILDAWATKSVNNLDDIKNGVSQQTKICKRYNMFCDDTKTGVDDSSDSNFKKVTLKDTTEKISVVYYKYNKSLYTEKLESSGALVDGNITDIEKIDFGTPNVTVDENSKIKYTVIVTGGTEFSITDKDTINDIIKDDLGSDEITEEKAKEKITEKIKTIMGTDYKIEEGVGDIGNDQFARVYNVVDSSGNKIATNIYQIDTNVMTILTSFMLKNQFENTAKDFFDKEIEADGQEYHIENIGSYYMTFKVSSASADDNCALFLKLEKEYKFGWNSNSISDTYIQNLKNIGAKYIKNDDGSYNVSFLKFEPKSTDAFIKHYTWDKTANCKAKLIEAYKYK